MTNQTHQQEVSELVERLESHMGKQDVAILLADCRQAASVIRNLLAALELQSSSPGGEGPAAAMPRLPSREEIARAIQEADEAFGYNLRLTRLVDGQSTYTLTMPGYDPVEVSEMDEGHALIAERRNKCRADAILALLSPSHSGETGEVERAECPRCRGCGEMDASGFPCMICHGSGIDPGEDEAAGEVETFATINQWCDDTFGAATVPQIIARAKEEWTELEEEGSDKAIEAADVVICLCRVPGFADALQRKMAINRKRKWRLVGNGTGYHIPETSPDDGGLS